MRVEPNLWEEEDDGAKTEDESDGSDDQASEGDGSDDGSDGDGSDEAHGSEGVASQVGGDRRSSSSSSSSSSSISSANTIEQLSSDPLFLVLSQFLMSGDKNIVDALLDINKTLKQIAKKINT